MKSTLLLTLSLIVLVNAKTLWSKTPATFGPRDSEEYLLKTGYPIGNGKLGAIPFGQPGTEKLNINVDSLWSGGPFESSDYTGGNPAKPVSSALSDIRATIFEDGTGDVSPLLGTFDHYGSYRVLGNVTITVPGVEDYSSYRRSLDLSTGIHTTRFTADDGNFTTDVFCSYPDQVCVYHIETTGTLPTLTVGLENPLVERDLMHVNCSENTVELTGHTQAGPPLGMAYSGVARVAGPANKTSCSSQGYLVVESVQGQKTQTIVVTAGTNYDQKKGNEADGYSFRGQDPSPVVHRIAADASARTYEQLLEAHLADYQALESSFRLDLPDPKGSSKIETAVLLSDYDWTGPGDPFLESLLFDYSRHLLISSSRDNSLPANLQGRWTERLDPAWSADYHANINLQMNYWAAEQTGLAATEGALWDYMEDTWVPRGTETAKLLYGADGWVVHNEMNIFGHTAMKDTALWANYPAAAAWMMQHVWDRYDYGRDGEWLRRQGYPLLKGVAQFWISQLQSDEFFNDDTLVANPCNSPEIGPTTFGCAHYQQLIHQLLDDVSKGLSETGEQDQLFVTNVSSALARVDRGIHAAEWGGLKEWKLPDSYGSDEKSTHRHLSHLVGWYPGYSMSSYAGGYKNASIQDAVRETLLARGMGDGEDANAGWEKVWRAACWARLNDTDKAYEELRYAIDLNFAANGLSMYDALDEPFQIDANFGLAGAVLSMLVVDLPLPYGVGGLRTVVLGPAIPGAWGNGSVWGLRIRGNVKVDFEWDGNGTVTKATAHTEKGLNPAVFVNVKGIKLAEIPSTKT
ncbi:glycoside hydrolase family 95 protein [Poronia punctata]|nr:glycoside hydrolase family 95 protein [Poronia punctata]